MLKIFFPFFFFFIGFVQISAQKDTIYIEAKLAQDKKHLTINQEIIFHNTLQTPLNKIKLLNFISAYQKKGTPLSDRKLEDRNTNLYFSKPENIGKLEQLFVTINHKKIATISDLKEENLYFLLEKPILPGEHIKINLQYQLQLPSIEFTGYGTSENKIALKYFFLVPDSFEDEKQLKKNYYDIEETANFNTFWRVSFDISPAYFVKSNLTEMQLNYFEGFLKNDAEFLITENNFENIKTEIDGKKITINFGYALSAEEKQDLEFLLPLQLKFIKEKIGILPENIFISEKFKKKEKFFGNDDVKFWKFDFQLFNNREKIDLDYISILTKNVVEQSWITNKTNDHWFKNGIKSYVEIEYLKKFYKSEKLLGDLPDNAVVFGLKPLKIFHASKLKLLDRYGLAYQYIMTQNLDQKIAEPFMELSNYNEMAISNFEMGSLFNFIAEKMRDNEFEVFLKNYLTKNNAQRIDTKNFLNELSISSHGASLFLQNYFEHKNRGNFILKNFKKENENYNVKIAKNTIQQIPFKLETQTDEGEKKTYWFEGKDEKSNLNFLIPQSDAVKIILNDNYIFPEANFRDNYLYTKGLFSNRKKIKFKFIKDIPNPEYNEIYLNPRVNFNNAYDKFVIGLNFKNKSLFNQKFLYSVTPSYSSGAGKLTGSAGISYSFLPPESFYRSLSFGISGSYYHYDYNLAYQKISSYVNLAFNKNPRSSVNSGLGLSYSYFQKDLTPRMILNNEYGEYNLWNFGYGYSDSKVIHEKSLAINTQWMQDFQKINAEAYYRWEFAPKKKMSFRFFAGYFVKNNTRNTIFDYGISRVSNYNFSYNLLGESATGGLLAQQFIMADAGFKSFIPGTVNQWVTSLNYDTHIWKIFNIYADAGLFKNNGKNTDFIWDSGVKLRIIPDFLEVYLPVQSTLGFEPSFKDYGKRIRFTLLLNFSAVVNTLRRGWY